MAASLLLATSLCGADASGFARLVPLPSPRIIRSAAEYPGGNHKATHLLDGNPASEYSSNGAGTNTVVEFEFGETMRIAAFRHVDRNDPATIAASELAFADEEGKPAAAVQVTHVGTRGGVTFLALPEPIAARRVRWQVTRVGPDGYGTVGGAEIAFYAAGDTDPAPTGIVVNARAIQVIERKAGVSVQPLKVDLDYPYAIPADVLVRVEGQEAKQARLGPGTHGFTFSIPALDTKRALPVTVEYAGQTVARQVANLQPARKMVIYILPHSHTDIGYTEIQTEIEDKQVRNLLDGMAAARRTASYPSGARFVWNVEVMWAAELYLKRLSETQRKDFLAAVKTGQVALNGMYLNELTGLCRPEELVRLFRCATQMCEKTGVPIESAMISDVPGYAWGTVTAMAQAGVKYFSVAPNYFDRIGDILVQWENKPFYWMGPDGRSKVLVWIPYRGYAMSHIIHKLTPGFVEDYQAQMERTAYPYDIAYMRWSGHGDNAVPDPVICEFVKEWNATHEWPRFIISSTSEAFHAFEQAHGSSLPRVRGDWTPYWEDGAGSSALETALNRASSDRLIQAEALWATRNPRSYPSSDFEDAWRQVLLYSEHTWGAWCSISEPFRRETREQWGIKQGYAVTADILSRNLLSRALALDSGEAAPSAIDVANSTSWERTELVVVPKFLSEGLDRVTDDAGGPVASQRLRSGELVMLARSVPPFGQERYTLSSGVPHRAAEARANGNTLTNDFLSVRLDDKTGGIAELRLAGLDLNLADQASGEALGDYLYFNGENAAAAKRNGPVKITVHERGPLVASLMVESEAPGCHRLWREVRLVAGQDSVEIINTLDKARLIAPSYHAAEGKESLNFAFSFAVPEGQVYLDTPFAVIRPDEDQMPSACKNWFTVGRWADVANNDFGVTWVTLDAPLVQVGGLTATLLNSQANPAVWRKRVGPTQRLYSWAMNNHWGTNYRAYQEGPHVFRFLLRPHRRLDPVAASRLAIAASQPLYATPALGPRASAGPRLRLSSADVLVTGFKPSDDGRGVVLRLWGASGREARTQLLWSQPMPRRTWLSDTSERPLRPIKGEVVVPAWGLVTLRADL